MGKGGSLQAEGGASLLPVRPRLGYFCDGTELYTLSLSALGAGAELDLYAFIYFFVDGSCVGASLGPEKGSP